MKERIKLIFISFCSFMALGIDIVKVRELLLDTSKISYSNGLSFLKLGILGSFILLVFIYNFINKYKSIKSRWINVLSIVFSLLMIFGNSYKNYGNSSLVTDSFLLFGISILMAIGYYYIFSKLISIFFNKIDKYKKKSESNKFILLFKKHPFIISLVIIILCWLPYIISFYPIILSPDPSYQIKQFFGIRTKYADYAILLDENVVLTNHHPVIHTILLGGCLKLGSLIVNDNFGLFLYSFIQIIILSCTLSYTIKYMMEHTNISSKFIFAFLLIYGLVPLFPLYAMSGVKDVIFSSFVVLYTIYLHKIISTKGNNFKIKDYIKLFLIMILVILFRNNGLYVILLSFPFLFFLVKNNWKKFGILFILVLSFYGCFDKVILPAFKITPGSIREVLSIPFQQTARYVKYHEDELTDSDKEIIDKVLGYDDLAERYNPELSDPVKNDFNKYTSKDDLKEYFKVWFKGLLKEPGTYINATINNVYGYFYPEKLSWYIYYKFDDRILDDGFDYHYNSLDNMRDILSSFALFFPLIPLIGLLANIGFTTWLIFAFVCYILYKKRYRELIVYLPALITILICVASPANTYFRYVLPCVFSLPFLFSILFEKKASK